MKAPPAGAEAPASADGRPRVYKTGMSRGWWLRRRHYFLYIVREFTSVPLALWLLWFLVEIQRASNGPKGVIIHVKGVPPRVIVLSQFAMWLLASVVIAAVLIGFAR